jgi:hypothetical protein
MVKVKANGRILDSSGKPVIGRVYFYLKTGTHLMSVMHEDTKVIVGPGTPTYTWTGFECDAIPGANPGWFDYPGGLEPGEYVLHIHHGGKKEWAWPFNLTDGLKPQDVYIGGKQAPVPGPEPIPGNYPPITPLDKQFTAGTYTACISYYGAIGAPLARAIADVSAARSAGFGNARVWIDWDHKGVTDSTIFDKEGNFIEDKAVHLGKILDYCASIGFSLDLTMHSAYYNCTKKSAEGYDITQHKRAIRNVLTRWGKHPAFRIFDMANEAEVRGVGGHGSPDTGHVSPGRFNEMMTVVRSIPHTCLVCVSISSGGDGGDVIVNYKQMFRDTKGEILLAHFPRKSGWGAAEGPNGLALAKAIPGIQVYNQEPARNNYNGQNWPLSEFENSFKSSKAAGLVGECFHTGAGFDVRLKSMFEQFDNTEKQVIANVYNWIK